MMYHLPTVDMIQGITAAMDYGPPAREEAYFGGILLV